MDLLVSIKDEYKDQLSEVATNLKNAGMNIEQKLESLGILTGSVDSAETIDVLRKVEGVSHVTESRQVHIAPPDHPVQ
jgi:hypothetical protein